MKSLGKFIRTERGFPAIEFRDHYEAPCSLQASSIYLGYPCGESAVWLGIDDPKPKILASQAERFGIKTKETTGWVPYPIPKEVLIGTRMHLNREQVKSLIGHLKNWLDEGTFQK